MRASEPILLLTRPEKASHRFAAMMRDRLGDQVRICISPLLEIRPCVPEVGFQDAQGLIFTSSNGVDVVSALTKDRALPVFCVGAATGQSALDAGWTAQSVGHDAGTLIRGLLSRPPKGPLLHLRGVHGRGDVAGALTRSGLITAERIVYDQVLLDLSDEAERYLTGSDPVFVPLFSPRSAARFQVYANRAAPLYQIALSAAVAAETRGNCVVASRPDAAAMAQKVEMLIRQVCALETDWSAQ